MKPTVFITACAIAIYLNRHYGGPEVATLLLGIGAALVGAASLIRVVKA